jgi:hypothetical protein
MACPFRLAFAGSIKSRHVGMAKRCGSFSMGWRNRLAADWRARVSRKSAVGQLATMIGRPRGFAPMPHAARNSAGAATGGPFAAYGRMVAQIGFRPF